MCTIIINDYRIIIEVSQELNKGGKNVKNLDVRMLVSDHGLKYKDVAYEMNVTPEWLSRLLRDDLTLENKIRVMGAIERLTKGADK